MENGCLEGVAIEKIAVGNRGHGDDGGAGREGNPPPCHGRFVFQYRRRLSRRRGGALRCTVVGAAVEW